MAMSTTMAIALMLSAKTDKASKTIDKFVSKTANKIAELAGRSEDLIRKGFVDMEIGKSIAKPVLSLLDSAVKFEDKMADVAKFADVKIGTEAFNSLSQKALEVSKKMGIPAAEAAESMAQLAASGTSVAGLEQMAVKAAVMGKAFDISAGQAADGYKSIQAALGATDARMDNLMDVTNTLTNNFGKGKDAAAQLFTFMTSSGASVATSLKADEKFIAAIGNTMRNMGVETGVAGTAMERFRNDLLKNKDAAAMFNKAGGGERGIMAILERAKASGNATGWFLENKIAGAFASQLGQLAMNLNSEKGLKNQFKSIQNPANVRGSVQREADNRMSTNAEKLMRFNAQLEALKITAGSSLLPALNKLLTTVSPLIDKFAEWAKKNPGLIEKMLKLILLIGGLKVATGALKIGIGAFIGPFSKLYGYFAKTKDGVSLFSKHLQVLGKVKKVLGNKLFDARFFGEYYIRRGLKAIQAFGSGAGKVFLKFGGVIGKVAKIISGRLVKAILFIGRAFAVVGRALIANPVGAIIMGIALLAFVIIKNWKPITAFFSKLFDGVREKFTKFVEWFSNKWKWVKDHIIKPVGKFLGFGSGGDKNDAAIYTAVGQPATMPQLAPVRGGSNDRFSFAPVINVNGGMDNAAAQNLSAKMRRDFEKQMADYLYNKQRKNF